MANLKINDNVLEWTGVGDIHISFEIESVTPDGVADTLDLIKSIKAIVRDFAKAHPMPETDEE